MGQFHVSSIQHAITASAIFRRRSVFFHHINWAPAVNPTDALKRPASQRCMRYCKACSTEHAVLHALCSMYTHIYHTQPKNWDAEVQRVVPNQAF
eukprot:361497-Chlamydomonas_euryale.AAC.1